MKSTGIVRKIDDLGRIVIPKELRRNLNINIKDGLEIFVDEEKVILRKYEPQSQCAVTGEVSEKNKRIGDLVLSEEGANQLVERIQTTFNR